MHLNAGTSMSDTGPVHNTLDSNTFIETGLKQHDHCVDVSQCHGISSALILCATRDPSALQCSALS